MTTTKVSIVHFTKGRVWAAMLNIGGTPAISSYRQVWEDTAAVSTGILHVIDTEIWVRAGT